MSSPTLANRTALVTGGARGIGRAIALMLAEAGADVTVNYVTRAQEAEAVAENIPRLGRRALAVQADVAERSAVESMMERIARELGQPDILINNAGVAALRRGIDDLTEDDFDRTIAVNLKSVFLCTQAALPAMRVRGWGRIEIALLRKCAIA